ncbi:MAG: acyl carrier protein [Proteobacteria bacterium]|nr:acyl carrier protein [Pseudomonadota bacterium]
MPHQYERIHDWLIDYLADQLELDRDDILPTQPFSRFGLDSASTIILAGELMEWLGSRIDVDAVYQYPTVESLARHLAESLYGERAA